MELCNYIVPEAKLTEHLCNLHRYISYIDALVVAMFAEAHIIRTNLDTFAYVNYVAKAAVL